MNISYEYPVKVFKSEYQGKTYYKLGLSKKMQDGSYLNGYISCKFRNNVTIDDKKKIYLKNAWLTFYTKDKMTIPYIFINKFEYVEEAIKEAKQESDPFEEFSNEVILTDEDLPF